MRSETQRMADRREFNPMSGSRLSFRRAMIVLLSLIAIAALPTTTFGQLGAANFNFGGVFGGNAALTPPRFEARGYWARVVSVTPKWLVLQNEEGQQLPVASTAVNQFLMRWRVDPKLVTAGTLAEVTGIHLNSDQVSTTHLDLYMGSDRSLVTIDSRYLVGYNREVSQLTSFQANNFGSFSLLPGEEMIPPRRHVVGPLLSLNPIVIGLEGGGQVNALPDRGRFDVTQVTVGLINLVEPGDLVWYIPVDAGPRSMSLQRMVVYKDRIVPR